MAQRSAIRHTSPGAVIDDLFGFAKEHEGSEIIVITTPAGLEKIAEKQLNWFSDITGGNEKHSALLAGRAVYVDVDSGIDALLLVALSASSVRA